MLNKFIWTIFLGVILLPSLVLAADELKGTNKFFTQVLNIVKILIPLAFALAILFFFWGMALYIWSSGTGKDDGKKFMFWGVIAVFVMTSIWGLVTFIGGSLGIEKNAVAPNIPTIRK